MKWQPTEVEIRDIFGGALDMSNKRLIVGAHSTGKDVNPGQQYATGAAYILDIKNQKYWRILPPDPQRQGVFGKSVAISGNFVAIGASGVDGAKGAVYLYKYSLSDDDWKEIKTFTPTDVTLKQFGKAVVVEADTLACGAPGSGRAGSQDVGGVEIHSLTATDQEIAELANIIKDMTARMIQLYELREIPGVTDAWEDINAEVNALSTLIAEAILT
jgi:hypothetical protein